MYSSFCICEQLNVYRVWEFKCVNEFIKFLKGKNKNILQTLARPYEYDLKINQEILYYYVDPEIEMDITTF